MSKFDFPPKLEQVYSRLKFYDFIYRSENDRQMAACYNDVIENQEAYEEYFRPQGVTLEINGDRGYIHAVCPASKNKDQNYRRALRAAVIAERLSKLSSENTILINGDVVPGRRFNEVDIKKCLDDPKLSSVFGVKQRLDIGYLEHLGVIEAVPGGVEGHRDYELTPVYEYYIGFSKIVYSILSAGER